MRRCRGLHEGVQALPLTNVTVWAPCGPHLPRIDSENAPIWASPTTTRDRLATCTAWGHLPRDWDRRSRQAARSRGGRAAATSRHRGCRKRRSHQLRARRPCKPGRGWGHLSQRKLYSRIRAAACNSRKKKPAQSTLNLLSACFLPEYVHEDKPAKVEAC